MCSTMNVISKYKKFRRFLIAKFRLTPDNKAMYDTKEIPEINTKGHQKKDSNKGMMIDSSNTKGIKCRKDNDESCLV